MNNWFDDSTKNKIIDVTATLYDLWKEMIHEGKKGILCTGPQGAGRLALTSNELFDTITFLETIRNMEEIK